MRRLNRARVFLLDASLVDSFSLSLSLSLESNQSLPLSLSLSRTRSFHFQKDLILLKKQAMKAGLISDTFLEASAVEKEKKSYTELSNAEVTCPLGVVIRCQNTARGMKSAALSRAPKDSARSQRWRVCDWRVCDSRENALESRGPSKHPEVEKRSWQRARMSARLAKTRVFYIEFLEKSSSRLASRDAGGRRHRGEN